MEGGGAQSDSDYTHVAKLSGLPWSASYSDIAKLLSSVQLDKAGVWLLHNARYVTSGVDSFSL